MPDRPSLLDELRTEYERSEEHTSELQSQSNLVCRLLLEKMNNATLLHDEPTRVEQQRRDPLCHRDADDGEGVQVLVFGGEMARPHRPDRGMDSDGSRSN